MPRSAAAKRTVKPAKPRAKPKQKPQPTPLTLWDRLATSPAFAKKYRLFALLVLLTTTVFWALQSARLQLNNADQLVNPYLFEHVRTLRGALFPGAHTFLLKWPLFWLVKLLGFTATAYVAVTVGVVLLTVGGLAFILYRIERRPLVFGTLCLALASVLLLVPAQPYAGGLLPVNMAMLETRNLEYLLYIFSLGLLARSPRLRSRQFWAAIGCLGLLIASDKLFLIISLGGALLALVAYALSRGWKLVSLSVSWVVAGLAASVGALVLLGLLQASRLTHVAGQSGAGPYGLVSSAHNVVLGIIYAVLGLFTNFGANPTYDVTVLRDLPHQLLVRSHSLENVAYLANGVVMLAGLFLATRLLRFNLTRQKRANSQTSTASLLSIMLIWSSLAAIASFVATNHDYAVDARYLTLVLFAVFIAAATALRQRQLQPKKVLLVGAVLIVSSLAGLFAASHSFHVQRTGLATVSSRNATIAQVLDHRKSEALVGDYWRVLPIKFISRSRINVMPLGNCLQPRGALSSSAWQPNLNKQGFAYLLTLDASLTDYPHCSLQQVVAAYGRPNASTLIAGSLSNPKELLLFYDRGIHKSAPATKSLPRGPSTVFPISLSQLPYTACNVPTVMNVVAHEDDDLLFMNPTLIQDLKAGYCVRTVYVTAGDDGLGSYYWLGREQGSEAAYSTMLGVNNIWTNRIVQLSSHEYVTVANPKGNSKVSLVFMQLPDGNLNGQGFKTSGFESLARLEAGKVKLLNSVDGQSSYNSAQLSSALTTFMHFFQPTEINTQANFVSGRYPDHSDHLAVGRYVKSAYSQYELQQYDNTVTIPLKFYVGYPVHQMPANVSGADLKDKEAAYFAYAAFDGAVCHSIAECNSSSTLGMYLARQYQNPY